MNKFIFHHTEKYKGLDMRFFEPANGDKDYFIVTIFTKIDDKKSVRSDMTISKEYLSDSHIDCLEDIYNQSVSQSLNYLRHTNTH